MSEKFRMSIEDYLTAYDDPAVMARFLLVFHKGKHQKIYGYLTCVEGTLLRYKHIDMLRFWKAVRKEVESHENGRGSELASKN